MSKDQAVQPLKVAILGSRGYPSTYGGFETFVRRLAPWLATRGHEVTVYGRGNWRHARRDVGPVHVVETRGIDRKAAGTPSHGFTAAIDCLRHRPDVVLALNIANGPALPILRSSGVPVVMNVDGIEWERGKWGSLARRAFRLGARMSARFADVLIADSHEVARRWRSEFGAELVYIPYGADLVTVTDTAPLDQLCLVPGRYALAVARLVPENNIETFVEAMAAIAWTIPVVIVGDANYANPLEQRLRTLSSRGRVTWLGHVEDQTLLDCLWANAGGYFHGHTVGGTNPSLLQAMACGAPVVAIDTPYNAEVVGSDGELVPNDPIAIGRAFQRLIAEEDLRRVRGEVGRRIIERRYCWDDVLVAYEEQLLSAAQSGRRV